MGAHTSTVQADGQAIDAVRAAFGWGIFDRAAEVTAAVEATVELAALDGGDPSPEACESISATNRLGLRILGRWLATGEEITPEEGEQLATLGNLVDAVRLPGLVKTYLAFSERSMTAIEEEGARHGAPRDLIDLARTVLQVSTDASLVNMAGRLDDERNRLAAELRVEQTKLQHQALHDPLTGLPNRALLAERLHEAASQTSGSVGMVFIDLDGFKSVNDSLGHDAGDRLLRCVADRLSEICRPGDTVARLGGDEFVVLCPALDRGLDQASAIADRVLSALSHPCTVGGRTVTPSASVGVACAREGEDVDPEALLTNADAAMYVAKERGGGGQALFDSHEGHATARRARLKFDLRKAIDRGEMAVHYQPIVGAEGTEVVGMEALARWSHPQLGAIEPSEFVALAEESGAIRAIDDWVLARACHQAAEWRLRGWAIGISVNLSAHHLDGAALERTVGAALKDAGLPPDALTLELTESRLMTDPANVITALDRLTAMGVRLAIDDFGVGYSSLAYLQRLPIDSVKVDSSFIRGLGSPGHDTSVVRAIVQLAHSLGLHVVAEGVESEQELDAVRELGCDEIQGFLLARPVPATEVASPRIGC